MLKTNFNSCQDIDVLLINPGNLSQVYQQLGDNFSAIEPPSLAGLFATYLRNKGISVDILDAAAFNLSPEEVSELIHSAFKPILIVIVVYGFQPSASTQNMPSSGQIAKALKKKNLKFQILMTGTHPSALPSRTLKEEEIDFVASGEGPITILGLVNELKKKKADFENVPGLYYRKNTEIRATANAPLMEDLDNVMPSVSWDLLPMERYRSHNWHSFENLKNRKPYASIHTSLGCPFKCSFCCINAPFGRPSYRLWSPKTIGLEIDVLYNRYGVKNIKFVDEMFVLNKEHVLGICDELIARDYKLNIWAYARVDTIRTEFLYKLKKAGFRWLALGIESGSKHVRDGVEKGRFGTAQILSTIKKVQEVGINVIGNYIFGLPDDDFQSMQETLDLAIEANCEFANFYSAMAYPGSKLFSIANQKGWELPSGWIGYSQHSYDTHPLPTEALPSSEVLRFRDLAFHQYFSNPKYLKLVKEKFGDEALMNIEEMTKIKLKRRLLD